MTVDRRSDDPTEWVVADTDDPKARTDYAFPDDWGLRSPAEKDTWFKQERAYRQALRQDTDFGDRLRDSHRPSEHRVF
jgi:hypothetical protein